MQWFTIKTTNNKINLSCNILDILWHSTKLNINLKKKKKIAENIFSFSCQEELIQRNKCTVPLMEALLLRQMNTENTRRKTERGGKKRRRTPN